MTILPLGSFFSTTEILVLYWWFLIFSLFEFEKELFLLLIGIYGVLLEEEFLLDFLIFSFSLWASFCSFNNLSFSFWSLSNFSFNCWINIVLFSEFLSWTAFAFKKSVFLSFFFLHNLLILIVKVLIFFYNFLFHII